MCKNLSCISAHKACNLQTNCKQTGHEVAIFFFIKQPDPFFTAAIKKHLTTWTTNMADIANFTLDTFTES